MNGNGAGGSLHFLALASQIAKLLTVYFDGRVHRGNLLNLTPELGQNCQNIFFCDGDRLFFQDFTGDVLGVGGDAQVQDSLVGLVCMFKELHTPGGSAHKHRQNTGGHRVESAAVTDAPGLENAPQLGGHILACPILGFINNDNSVHQVFSHLMRAASNSAAAC